MMLGARVELRQQFSVSNFWPEVRKYGVTWFMMQGSVQQLPRAQPPCPEERDHIPGAFGEEDIKAFVVARPGTGIECDDLREHCRVRLAKFMVPAQVGFLDNMPRPPSGKPEKGKLAQIDRNPVEPARMVTSAA